MLVLIEGQVLFRFEASDLLGDLLVGNEDRDTGEKIEVVRIPFQTEIASRIEHRVGGHLIRDSYAQNGSELLIGVRPQDPNVPST